MDFSRPLHVVTPTLDGDVLAVLARTEAELSGRKIHGLVGHSSEQGVRNSLERLVGQGVVVARSAGQAKLYLLNREHLAAPYISGLVNLRKELQERLGAELSAWRPRLKFAAIFGSVARGEATEKSDLDIFLIRPRGADSDGSAWVSRVMELERKAAAWTGNDARVLDFGEDEIPEGAAAEPVLRDILREGLVVLGSRRRLRELIQRYGEDSQL
jgi:predicted nucleotidyltransferase